MTTLKMKPVHLWNMFTAENPAWIQGVYMQQLARDKLAYNTGRTAEQQNESEARF